VERVIIDAVKDRLAIDVDLPEVGLCLTCEYARRVEAKETSVYFLCERSLTEPSLPKYPRLPVLRCWGYAKVQGAEREKA
jgi:hypothetical protein